MNPIIQNTAAKKFKSSPSKLAAKPTELRFTLDETLADGTLKKVTPREGTIEAHAVATGALKAHFEAIKAMKGWATGREVTDEEFLAAADELQQVNLR